jgi:hypothetical protein
MTRRFLLVLILLTLVGCGSSEGGSDAGAEAACQHFRNVVGDADILNNAEFREKLKEVHDSASATEDAELRESARGMLASVTEGSPAERFKWHADDFVAACRRLGLYGDSQ